jgi:hypothetical protein
VTNFISPLAPPSPADPLKKARSPVIPEEDVPDRKVIDPVVPDEVSPVE